MPALLIVKAYPPSIAPLNVNSLELDSAVINVSPTRVKLPESSWLPFLDTNEPDELIPVPTSEIGSAITKLEPPPSIINLAPDEILVGDEDDPRAVADVTVRVPADTVVTPVYVLFPESVKSPADNTNPPEPLI